MRRVMERLFEKESMSETEAYQLMDAMMAGELSDEQISGILSVIRFRGETVSEMTGFARAMRDRSRKISHSKKSLIDTCGTGGDGSSTFNISTAAAILVSASGIPVAKHGNRSVSSTTGSADVLESLGIPVQSREEEAEALLERCNLCFMFAPVYHSSMKNVAKARKSLGVKTVFNLLGPLTNPAQTKHQLIGVYDRGAAVKMAETARRLGTERALFVTGVDGLDELTITGKTYITELKDGRINSFTITPEEAGAARGTLEELKVNRKEDSAALIREVMENIAPESASEIVILNAGAALYTAGEAETIRDGVNMARKTLVTGAGKRKLEELSRHQERRVLA
ncbi:anthranilate phosphoribosyltransferase [Alteribacter natronophilus]|uniref:anthranilate phosphoribosyltransferase n=1 Tax=Alteribacter natronophilus TaxID=2583810 RepID=UPI00110F4458|nr:anthranilate phosphoribosyltransferase [Alteribacter natronophilus]TMW73592.1 anthranilate phosphoribosyltransferase [Alteribacter natronophilus]